MEELSKQSVKQLFTCVLQHMKCIEIRIQYAKALTSQKQKYALDQSMKRIQSAMTSLYDLLPNSQAVMEVKKELDKSDMVYVMLLTEQLSQLQGDDMENVIDLVQNYVDNKYGKEQMSSNGEDSLS